MPKIGGHIPKLHDYWQEVLDSGHFTEGKFVRRFEDMVSDLYGMHAVAVNSAGSGLYAVLRNLDISRGYDIAVPNNTFACTALMAAEIVGKHHVRLVDAKKSDFSMCAEDLISERKKAKRLEAVMLTHVGGGLAEDYGRIAELCREWGIPLIEDAAHAFGTVNEQGELAGTLGEAAVFSLYPTKAVPVGEGGVVVTKNAQLAEDVRRFRNYGKFYDEDGKLRYSMWGFNFRMDEWTAAVAVHQVERIAEILERRANAAYRLNQVVPALVKPTGTNWYKYIAPADFKARRQTGKVYAYEDQMTSVMRRNLTKPNSLWIADNHICLPLDEGLYGGLSTSEIEAWLMGHDISNPNWRKQT